MIEPPVFACLVAGIATPARTCPTLAPALVAAVDLPSIVRATNVEHRLACGTNQLKNGIVFVHPQRMNENSTNVPRTTTVLPSASSAGHWTCVHQGVQICRLKRSWALWFFLRPMPLRRSGRHREFLRLQPCLALFKSNFAGS